MNEIPNHLILKIMNYSSLDDLKKFIFVNSEFKDYALLSIKNSDKLLRFNSNNIRHAIEFSYKGFNTFLTLTPEYLWKLQLQDYSCLRSYLKKIKIIFIDDFPIPKAYKFIKDDPYHKKRDNLMKEIIKLDKDLISDGVVIVQDRNMEIGGHTSNIVIRRYIHNKAGRWFYK